MAAGDATYNKTAAFLADVREAINVIEAQLVAWHDAQAIVPQLGLSPADLTTVNGIINALPKPTRAWAKTQLKISINTILDQPET